LPKLYNFRFKGCSSLYILILRFIKSPFFIIHSERSTVRKTYVINSSFSTSYICIYAHTDTHTHASVRWYSLFRFVSFSAGHRIFLETKYRVYGIMPKQLCRLPRRLCTRLGWQCIILTDVLSFVRVFAVPSRPFRLPFSIEGNRQEDTIRLNLVQLVIPCPS